MAEGNTKFWKLVLTSFQKDVNKCEDNLIILVHWLLLSNNYQALGPGNENEIVDGEEPTDILQENWSQGDTYKLRYARGNKLFILNGVKVGDSLIFNFYNVETKQVSSASIGEIATVVKCVIDMKKNKDDFFDTVNLLQKDLIDPMQIINDDKKAVSTQTQSQTKVAETSESPLLISRTEPSQRFARTDPFPSYGMPDLDPLGGLRQPGGGMLFDPLLVGGGRPGMFPGVPPSARFDPIQPPNADPFRNRRPNPDHMRPPDFDDNLYM